MSDCLLKVEKLENGYEVEIRDPEIDKANRDPKSKTPWQEPWKCYAFATPADVAAFVTAHLDKLKPPPSADVEFAGAFAKAASSKD